MGIAASALALGSALGASAWLASAMAPRTGPFEWLGGAATWRLDGSAVALSFDDGPHPRWTPRVLDALASAGVRATFFVVGRRAARNPALVRRIAAEGHTIGNHGWGHRALPWLGTRTIAAEIDRCQATLANLTGVAPTLLRPPHGHRDPRVYRAARQRGLTTVMWSVDSLDWLSHQAAPVHRRLRRAGRGDIVLLHDGQHDARHTLAALVPLLQRLARRGLPCVALTPERCHRGARRR